MIRVEIRLYKYAAIHAFVRNSDLLWDRLHSEARNMAEANCLMIEPYPNEIFAVSYFNAQSEPCNIQQAVTAQLHYTVTATG